MSDQPTTGRFKTQMPHIPGVAASSHSHTADANPVSRLVIGVVAVFLVVFLGARWALRPKHAQPLAQQQPQIDVPSPAPDPSALMPHATDAEPAIAEVREMAKSWSSKEFFIRNRLTGQNVQALLIRLPIGSPAQASGYWAFGLSAPFGNCQLEYIADLNKLRTDYGFRAAKHPMVGNPCSRTVFDPLRMSNLPGNVFVRGAIVQGSDLRPPLGVELKIRGNDILAVRTE